MYQLCHIYKKKASFISIWITLEMLTLRPFKNYQMAKYMTFEAVVVLTSSVDNLHIC